MPQQEQHPHGRPSRHPAHGIVPPYILEAIARNGTEEQRGWAAATLAQDAELRASRARTAPGSRPPSDAEPVEGVGHEAVPPRRQREIHDGHNRADLPGTLVRREGDGPTGDRDVDRAFDGLGATWDLYFDVYGRNSYDDEGATITATVNHRRNYNNAFWNGEQLVFGDGDGQIFQSFTIPIDVMAHEVTHAVTDHESGLVYEHQSGALNEHLSDVFGSLVKQRVAGETAAQADWLVGEGLLDPSINGVALRSMIAPGTAFNDPLLDGKDPQPGHMDDYVHTDEDSGGVHTNSGIPNRAFVLFAQALGGFAWERAGRAWYGVATDPALDEKADFQDFANLTVDRAYAMFGHETAKACADAWAAVGITVPWNRHVNRTAEHDAPTATGVPTATVISGIGVHNIAYRAGNGHLHELWRDAAGNTGTSDLTALASAPTATHNAFAYSDQGRNTEILLFRSGDGHVRSLYWSTGPVGHDDLSGTAGSPPASGGTPVGYHYAPSDTHTVVYRGQDGHLHSLYWVGVNTVVYDGNLTGTIGAPTADGDPCGYVTPDGTNIVPYRSVDGRILSVYWNNGPSGLDNLSGVAGTPPAAGDPVALYTAHNDTHHIFYVATDGHLYELFWLGIDAVQGRNLTATAGAPLPTGKPTAVYNPVHDAYAVYFRRHGDAHLHELWWRWGDVGINQGDVTANSFSPAAADSPMGFVVDADRSAHLVYRGDDDHIHEISWR